MDISQEVDIGGCKKNNEYSSNRHQLKDVCIRAVVEKPALWTPIRGRLLRTGVILGGRQILYTTVSRDWRDLGVLQLPVMV
jgi:hypothetical protein